MTNLRHRIPVVASKTALLLGFLALLLVLASITGQLTRFWAGHGNVYGLVPLFNVELEDNFPSSFSALMLLFAGLLLGIIAVFKKTAQASYSSHWAILAFGFLYLAVDEATSIHELLHRPTSELLGDYASGIFYYAWVIPGIAFVLLFALTFVKFLLHLHLRTRWLFLVGAILFVGGAIGIEAIGGRYNALHGSDNLTYNMIATLEESLEMAGVIVFIFALLEYIETNYKEVGFHFGNAK
ncbi:MAG: hypothetical protein V3W24_00875 [Gemmatimonadota bacterium]